MDTENHKYKKRLVEFYDEIVMDVVHVYFEREILDRDSLFIFLDRNAHILFHKYISKIPCCKCGQMSLAAQNKNNPLNQAQFDLLYDSNGDVEQGHEIKRNGNFSQHCLCKISPRTTVTVIDMDIILIYTIIKVCCTSYPGNPQWLEDIKNIRNSISHLGESTTFSENDFHSKWQTLQMSVLEISRITGTAYENSVKKQIHSLTEQHTKMDNLTDAIKTCNEISENKILEALRNFGVQIGNISLQIKKAEFCTKKEMNEIIGSKKTHFAEFGEDQPSPSPKENKCFVTWKFATPGHWDVTEMVAKLSHLSAFLDFKVEFVYEGSLVVMTSTSIELLCDETKFTAALSVFIKKLLEECEIDFLVEGDVEINILIAYDRQNGGGEITESQARSRLVQENKNPNMRLGAEKNKQRQQQTDRDQKDRKTDQILSRLEGNPNQTGRPPDEIKELKSPDKESLKFITPLEDKTCFEGETVSLECTVSGGKKPSKWYRDDLAVLSDNLRDESKDQTYKLTILHATREDDGIYQIKIGDSILEVRLTVLERIPSLIELRNYQIQLAEIALNGENTIICAGTNAGKTFVAFHIIEDHLLKKPKGKVIFINKTNVLLEQQYQRACQIFTTLHFQGKIYKWQAGEDDDEDFVNTFNNTQLMFLTPKSLSNHLDENTRFKISIGNISLIILDECHHAFDKNLYNELMSFYRIEKYNINSSRLPQILGLTASPGTNKARNVQSAVDHLRKLMANLDVKKLSVVKKHKEELLTYSSTPIKGMNNTLFKIGGDGDPLVAITSTSRLNDPVKSIILEAMGYVEKVFHSEKVTTFLTNNFEENKELLQALYNPPKEKTELHYIQWMMETREKVEYVLLTDPEVPRLLQACIRHLELYADCLEVNSLLEIKQVRNLLTDGFGLLSSESSRANTNEERDIVAKLRAVLASVIGLGDSVENNPDIEKIISTIEEQYKRLGEESRFLIFVKARATAEALADRLPQYLRSTHLTGSHKSIAEGGRPVNEQLEVVDHFRNGEHLCIVATSVACEGLDIQQCNVVIRYKFIANEISSLQMRGRIRQKEGTEILVGSGKEIEFEKVNIERQYLMNQAIEKVISLDQVVLARDIALAERDVYATEDLERQTANLRINHKTEGLFSIFCKYCGYEITDGSLIRSIKGRLFIVYDKEIFGKVQKKHVRKKMKNFDGCQKREKVYGLQCGHNWGSIIIFQECEFVSLSQNYIKFFDRKINKFIECKKWSDLKYVIPEISTEEIFEYNRD